MFIPLIDLLRCPRAVDGSHADTWLVASIDRAAERDMVDGRLGCPLCQREYPVRNGVVSFSDGVPRPPRHPGMPSEEEAVRLAAALNLVDARMIALLDGAWGVLAPVMRAFTPAQLLLLNPPEGISTGDGVSIVLADAVPIARAAVHAVAADRTTDAASVGALVPLLRPAGRMLGRAHAPVPAGLTEMARDADVWVAELPPGSDVSPPIMPLRRR